MIFWRCPPVK
uniref:Uncharacterized protein n=1 Tax=Anguilla anguilla TaxID=7936 RepID=A0A0E9SZN2_ANGAN